MCQLTICTYLVLHIRTEVCNSCVSGLVALNLGGLITEEALMADPARLLRETTGISLQIF